MPFFGNPIDNDFRLALRDWRPRAFVRWTRRCPCLLTVDQIPSLSTHKSISTGTFSADSWSRGRNIVDPYLNQGKCATHKFQVNHDITVHRGTEAKLCQPWSGNSWGVFLQKKQTIVQPFTLASMWKSSHKSGDKTCTRLELIRAQLFCNTSAIRVDHFRLFQELQTKWNIIKEFWPNFSP